MATSNQQIEINLSRHNAALLAKLAAVKNTTVEELASFCLKGSTNLNT